MVVNPACPVFNRVCANKGVVSRATVRIWLLLALYLPISAYLYGYTEGEIVNPFEWTGQTETVFHQKEAQAGIRGVRDFWRQMKLDAYIEGDDMPEVDDRCHLNTHVWAVTEICDYRE